MKSKALSIILIPFDAILFAAGIAALISGVINELELPLFTGTLMTIMGAWLGWKIWRGITTK
jgi:hypothetical protein